MPWAYVGFVGHRRCDGTVPKASGCCRRLFLTAHLSLFFVSVEVVSGVHGARQLSKLRIPRINPYQICSLRLRLLKRKRRPATNLIATALNILNERSVP